VRGAPIKNVFVQIDKPIFHLLAQPEAQRGADLAGKTVGILSIGGVPHLSAVASLRAQGVSTDEITFVPGMNSNQGLAALQAGAVAAAVVTPPVDVIAEGLGFRNLGFVGDHFDDLTAGLATHADTVRDRAALVRAMVRAELKAHRYLQRNREGSIAHMAGYLEMSPTDAAISYDRDVKHLTPDGLTSPERLERMIANQRRELGVEEPLALDDVFDLRYVRQALDELAREGWQP
jgi:ABC-type nitrate/sulfonate/bicarbonate transport system substrate-binding protein